MIEIHFLPTFLAAFHNNVLKKTGLLMFALLLASTNAFGQKNETALVGALDLSKREFKVAQLVAKTRSHDGIVLFYTGKNPVLMQEVYEGLTAAAKDGANIESMILGPASENDTFVFYYMGILFGKKPIDAAIHTKRTIKELAKYIHNKGIDSLNGENSEFVFSYEH